MLVDDIFLVDLDGESTFKLKVKDNPNVWGIIEKEYSKNQRNEVFAIKYYWNNVYQGIKYADDMEQAKEKLKRILKQVLDQTTNMKYIQTFEKFKK